MKTTISDFTFIKAGHGHYSVIYTSPKTGIKWNTTINDMSIIDDTRNSDFPKQKDLEMLKYIVKN